MVTQPPRLKLRCPPHGLVIGFIPYVVEILNPLCYRPVTVCMELQHLQQEQTHPPLSDLNVHSEEEVSGIEYRVLRTRIRS